MVALTLASCRRDPATAKKHYVESGDKYAERGGFKFAVIQYQNAVKIDPKYGIAHYKLAGVYMKVTPPAPGQAEREYRRAIELLKDNQAYQHEYTDSLVQLSQLEIYFQHNDKQIMEDVKTYCAELLQRDPNSFDGLRLSGDYNHVKAIQAVPGSSDAQALYDAAMDYYRKADAIKPGQPLVDQQIGSVLLQEKRYQEAEPYYRKVIEQDKANQSAYRDLYRLLMLEQRPGDAEALLKLGAQNNPKAATYLVSLAYHYGSLGRRDDMLSVLQQIKAHSQDFASVYQIVGDFYVRMGDPESALREYRDGILQDPKHKSTYQHSVIEVLLRQNKKAEAAEMNNQILKENPKDPDAKSLAANFLMDQGDINAALTQLQAVVTSSPDNATAHYLLGRAFMVSGRPDGAEAARQQFEQSISLQQNQILPRLGLAQLQVAHSQYEAALDSVAEILKRDPNNLNAKLIQSQALVGMKKYGESDSLLGAILKGNPNNPDVYFQNGMAQLAQNKPKDAEKSFARAYELNPHNSQSLLGVVNALLQQGEQDKAMTFLQTESAKAPNRLDILFLMGTTAQREGRYAQALTNFGKVLSGLDKKNPGRADLYLQLGDTYRMMGNLNDALSNVQKAKEIKPDNENVLYALGFISDLAGHKPEARQAYEACLHVNPNNAFALNNLAYLMADMNLDIDVALSYAQKAKGLEPNMAEISDTLGWILLKKNLPTQAATVFQDLVKKVPGNSTFHYHLAKAYQQVGDNAKASEELREALKHSPAKGEQQEIQDMLSRIGKP